MRKKIARRRTGHEMDRIQRRQAVDASNNGPPIQKRQPKWKRKKIVATTATVATMQQLQQLQQSPMRIGKLVNLKLPKTEDLVDDFLRTGLILVAGAGKIGKTVFLLQLSLALSRGSKFLGFNTKKRKIAYITLENTAQDIKSYASRQGYNKEDPAYVFFPKWVSVNEGFNKIREFIHKEGFEVVIIDSLESFSPTLNHNDSKEVKPLLQELRDILRGTSATIILVDHCNKLVYNGNSRFF